MSLQLPESIFEKAKQHFLWGLDYISKENWVAAEKELKTSLRYVPNRTSTLTNLCAILIKLKQFEEAAALIETAKNLKLESPELILNQGLLFSEEKLYSDALISFDRSIELKPNYAEAWSNRGLALNNLRRHEEAIVSYERSIELKPDYAEAWSNRGAALNNLKRHEEALASYERAIELKPNGDFWLGSLVHTQMKVCDWTDLEQRRRVVEERLLSGRKVSNPFVTLGLFDNPKLQKQCAEIYAKDTLNPPRKIGLITKRAKQKRIRIGYFSADFHNHATMYLMSELFELHDKNHFEIYAFSFGPDRDDEMRRRAENAFDKFIDVRNLNDAAVAALSQESEISIAIELKGYTEDSRPEIFAERAAPIQINYLGYPGTMGSQHFDYLIADSTLIPQDAQEAYSEKIIYLPHSYQPNDSRRRISDRIFMREEVGLPACGFVFCCFNNNWKITPEIFDCWGKILQSSHGSVLWLFEDNPAVVKNLRKETASRNVDPERLVFAKRMTHSEHLARYKLADLFLDTFPYNAHTTASDALWAGVPVLTLQGQSFAARVAASLLTNIGVPELITQSEEEYCSLAIELALNADKLNAIRTKLDQNRVTTPLFNTRLFARHIESAYLTAYNRYQVGLPPDHIYVRA
jgi:protein O-GlcNAc transferase